MDNSAPANNGLGTQGVFSQINISNERSITDILFEERTITSEQYSNLKVESANKGQHVDKILLDSKIVPDEKYYEARAKLVNVPFISIANLPSSPEALGFITKPIAERLRVI